MEDYCSEWEKYTGHKSIIQHPKPAKFCDPLIVQFSCDNYRIICSEPLQSIHHITSPTHTTSGISTMRHFWHTPDMRNQTEIDCQGKIRTRQHLSGQTLLGAVVGSPLLLPSHICISTLQLCGLGWGWPPGSKQLDIYLHCPRPGSQQQGLICSQTRFKS